MSKQKEKAEIIEDGAGTYGLSVLETEKGKEGVSSLFGVCGLLLAIVVWCTCPLKHSGIGQIKDMIQGPITSHLFPEARGLGVEMSTAGGLDICVIASSDQAQLILL